jgi:hypothetical protein
MGLEDPNPGSLAFQRRFSVSLQVVGTWESRLTPEPFGPRNRSQSSPRAGETDAQAATAARHATRANDRL